MNTQLTEVIFTLVNAQGSAPGQQWKINNQTTIRVGRAPDNDVVVNDPMVSRHHIDLHKIDDMKWQLVNRGTNGTFVNGILVSQSLVTSESVIQMAQGGPTLKFQIYTSSIVPNPDAASLPPIPPIPQIPQVGGQAIAPTVVCTHVGNPPGNLFCIHCGQPAVQVQQFIRQYQVLRTLGQGGMGTTYLAWDKDGGQPGRPKMLVLKEMNADMAQIEKARELFEREARILKNLQHPGIPKYYDFFVEAGKKYLAMELIHGQDLEKRIYQQGPVPPSQAIEWAIQTCDVLDYIHRQHPPLIHRDIKPANLMVRTLNNQIVVLDFGAVKEIGTSAGTRIGAEGYCAPEQYRGQPCTQSDLFAIGPTLIFLMTAKNPMDFYHLSATGYQFKVENVPTIAPRLRATIEKATATKVGDRYQTAKELSQALLGCL
jgi:serine/threonine-protein kinase